MIKTNVNFWVWIILNSIRLRRSFTFHNISQANMAPRLYHFGFFSGFCFWFSFLFSFVLYKTSSPFVYPSIVFISFCLHTSVCRSVSVCLSVSLSVSLSLSLSLCVSLSLSHTRDTGSQYCCGWVGRGIRPPRLMPTPPPTHIRKKNLKCCFPTIWLVRYVPTNQWTEWRRKPFIE